MMRSSLIIIGFGVLPDGEGIGLHFQNDPFRKAHTERVIMAALCFARITLALGFIGRMD